MRERESATAPRGGFSKKVCSGLVNHFGELSIICFLGVPAAELQSRCSAGEPLGIAAPGGTAAETLGNPIGLSCGDGGDGEFDVISGLVFTTRHLVNVLSQRCSKVNKLALAYASTFTTNRRRRAEDSGGA